MEKLYIVMPAYNEEENIKSVVEQWYPVLKGKDADSRIVITDSNSIDKTHEILKNMISQGCSQLEIFSDTAKQHCPKFKEMSMYEFYTIKAARRG